MRWKTADYEKHMAKKSGKVLKPRKPAKNAQQKALEELFEPTGKQHIRSVLISSGLPFVTEFVFAPPRKFSFDFAVPDFKIAIEYEGVFSGKSRHTTLTGYTMDCEKYNLAASMGWRVFRYTAINYKDFNTKLLKQTI